MYTGRHIKLEKRKGMTSLVRINHGPKSTTPDVRTTLSQSPCE